MNKFLKVLPFHMLTTADVLQAVTQRSWFTTIDLKDAYFHVPIAPHHRIAQIQENQGVQIMPPGTADMERWVISDQRLLIGFDPLTPRGGGDRCFALWMGRSMAAQSGEGALECTGDGRAHKCV